MAFVEDVVVRAVMSMLNSTRFKTIGFDVSYIAHRKGTVCMDSSTVELRVRVIEKRVWYS
jgi:hypothetical protein